MDPSLAPFGLINMDSGPRRGDAPAVLNFYVTTPGSDAFWSRCAARLAASGVQMIACVTGDRHSACPLPGLQLSLMSCDGLGDRWPSSAPLDLTLGDDTISRCVAYSKRYWRPGEDRTPEVVRGARAMAWLVEDALRRLSPRLVLNWHGNAGLLIVLDEVVRRHGVPMLYAERGCIHPTFILDRHGAVAPSEYTRDAQVREFMSAPPTASEIERGRQLATALVGRRAQNWQHSNSKATATGPAPNSGMRRRIVYFSSNDMGHEGAPESRWADLGTPFGDSCQAFASLLAGIERVGADVDIVVKPHPFEPNPDRYHRFLVSDRVRIDPEVSVYDALERGDCIATTSASIGWIAISAGAPFLAMTTRSFSGAGVAFEPSDEAQLRDAIAAMLEDRRSEGRAERGFAALWRYASRCFTTDENLEGLGVPGAERSADTMLAFCARDRSASRPDLSGWRQNLRRLGVAAEGVGAPLSDSYLETFVRPDEVAESLARAVDPTGPVVLVGLGKNGRRVAAALDALGVEWVGYDDDAATRTSVRRSVGSFTEAPSDATWIISPLRDTTILARLPAGARALRWKETLRSLAAQRLPRPGEHARRQETGSAGCAA